MLDCISYETLTKALDHPVAPESQGIPFEIDDFEDNIVVSFLDKYEIKHTVKDDNEKTLYELDECPFNPSHKSSGLIFWKKKGNIGFKCFHDSCSSYKITDAVQALSGGEQKYLSIRGRSGLDFEIENLNKKHAVINLNGKFVILNEGWDPITNRPHITFSTLNDFLNFYKNRTATVYSNDGVPYEESVGQKWVESRKRREYTGVVFDPQHDYEGYYNIFQGFNIEPKPGDCSLFKQHIYQIIASDCGLVGDYIWNWMADCIQNPGGPRCPFGRRA